MSDTILLLAVQAIDDADARPVLQDAILELGPSITVDVDRGLVRGAASGRVLGTTAWDVTVRIEDEWYGWTHREPWTPEDDVFARALAAVLLCRGWGTKPWPMVADSVLSAQIRAQLTGRLARSFTRQNLRDYLDDCLRRIGHGGAIVRLHDVGPAAVVAHIDAPIPDVELEMIRVDLDRWRPMTIRVDVTSHSSLGCEFTGQPCRYSYGIGYEYGVLESVRNTMRPASFCGDCGRRQPRVEPTL